MPNYLKDSYKSKFVEPVTDFVAIPNLSPAYDDTFFENGQIDRAIEYVISHAKSLNLDNISFHIERGSSEDKTCPPLVCIVLESTQNINPHNKNVMIYGHLDKQPHLTEQWSEGLHPVKPVLKNDRLYGRGAADDGYAVFAALLAVRYNNPNNVNNLKI